MDAEEKKKKEEEAAAAKKEGSSRKGRTFRKLSEEVSEEEGEEGQSEEEPSDEVSGDEEAAAEQVLADMASMPAGGGAPDMAMAGDQIPVEGAQPQLSPEEEAALMALMQQEGLKESDVKAFAKASAMIANGQIDTTKLSNDQVNFLQVCDGAVKRAGAKFQTLRSASRLRNELNSIYKGIQS